MTGSLKASLSQSLTSGKPQRVVSSVHKVLCRWPTVLLVSPTLFVRSTTCLLWRYFNTATPWHHAESEQTQVLAWQLLLASRCVNHVLVCLHIHMWQVQQKTVNFALPKYLFYCKVKHNSPIATSVFSHLPLSTVCHAMKLYQFCICTTSSVENPYYTCIKSYSIHVTCRSCIWNFNSWQFHGTGHVYDISIPAIG